MLVSQEDARLFFRLMLGLQLYVNQQRQILPNIQSLEAYMHVPMKDKTTLLDVLWKNPDLIDAYIKEPPNRLSPDDLDIIRKWKGFVAGKFYIFRYLKDYAVFIGGSKVYAVLALFDSFDQMLGQRPLPVMVDTVLLPFKGKIIYDGSLQRYNISFGGGVRSDLNEQYLAAKQNGRIIASLEPETAAARPIQQRRVLDKDSEELVAEIVKASDRLKGGTAIQSAAFGLLRASAKLVEETVQNPDDPDGLERATQQVRTAVNRVQTVLNRAER